LTLGFVKPVILLPRGWQDWPAEQQEWALRHEFAHVRRRDFLGGLVAELAVCLCWFHPLVRWLANRLRLEQEYAADAWVASALNDSAEYVRCLARLALTGGRGRPSLAPAFWRRRPEILRRIDMLRRNTHGQPPRLGRRAAWTLTVLTAAVCLTVAGVGPLRSVAVGQPPAQPGRATTDRATADPQGDALPAGALARLGTTRLRHDGDVRFVFFGADGKSLLTAGQDGTLRLWDLGTGKEIRRFDRRLAGAPGFPAPGDGRRPPVATPLMIGGPGGGFCAALSTDGKILAATGAGVVQLWEVETGKELRQIRLAAVNMPGMKAGTPLPRPAQVLQGAAGALSALLFSPDGRTLAGRASNGGLFVWEVESGKEIHHIKPVTQPGGNRPVTLRNGEIDVPGMAFTSDGKLLAAAMTDYEKEAPVYSIKLWDLETGKESRRIKTQEGVPVSGVAVAPSGKLLAYEGQGIVHLCEVETGKEVHSLRAADSGSRGLVFTPDGKTLIVRGNNLRVRLWDTTTGKEVRQLGDPATTNTFGVVNAFIAGVLNIPPETRLIALSPDGTRVVSASGNTVRLWEVATGKELPLTGGHRRAPTSVALSPDGKTTVSWGTDFVVRRWETATGKQLSAFPSPTGTTLATFSTDGQLVALANTDGSVRVHNTTSGVQLHRFTVTQNGPARVNFIAGLVFSRDGHMLAVRSSLDSSVRLYDVARGTELRVMGVSGGDGLGPRRVVLFGAPTRGNGPGLAFSPDGKLLVSPGPGNNSMAVLDVASGKELRRIPLTQAVNSFTFSPDGRTLATENADLTVTLWEIASGKERARLGTTARAPQRNEDQRVLQLALAGGRPGGSMPDPTSPLGLTFSPDGSALAVRGGDRQVHLWDVVAGKEIGQLKGHSGQVETIAFAPDGKAIVSGADDTTLLVWDAADPLRSLAKPQSVELSAQQLETLWGDLANEHGGKALRGVLGLAGTPGQAAPYLAERVKPAAAIDPKKIQGWLADLESAKYAVRQEASASLLKCGEQALPALRKLLAASPTLETRKRAEDLVERLITGALTQEQLRVVRAIESLERMGTPEARRLLRTLSEGGPGALPTREAQAALDRLGASQP
jgi:WD40 repeat protein